MCDLIDLGDQIPFWILKISDLDEFQDEHLGGYSHSVPVMLC